MEHREGMMGYTAVQTIWRGDVNDVMVCRKNGDDSQKQYTVLDIKDREHAKRLLTIDKIEAAYEQCFSWKDHLCVVFPYVPERMLKQMAQAGSLQPKEYRDICEGLAFACIGTELPFPLLYLVLLQERIHRGLDGEVYISYDIDLKGLDEEKTETECANLCVSYLLRIYEEMSVAEKKSSKDICYNLLLSKAKRTGYHSFLEVYQDIRVAEAQKGRKGWLVKVRGKKDTLAKVVLGFGIIFFVAAVVIFAMYVIKPNWLFRFWQSSFEYIGTESLVE